MCEMFYNKLITKITNNNKKSDIFTTSAVKFVSFS